MKSEERNMFGFAYFSTYDGYKQLGTMCKTEFKFKMCIWMDFLKIFPDEESV